MTESRVARETTRRTGTHAGRVLFYMVCLAPFSLTVGGTGVSANYLFAVLLLSPRGFRRNQEVLFYVGFMAYAFLGGVVLFSGFDPAFMLRQTISFGLALAAIAIVFVRLGVTLDEFVIAVVLVSVAYALFALSMVLRHDFTLRDIYEIKGMLRPYVPDWPQRYVVVLLFGLFAALGRFFNGLRWQIAFVAILICVFLTFTRGAWIATGAGVLVYAIARPRRARPKGRRRLGARLAGALVLATLAWVAFNNELIRSAIAQVMGNIVAALTLEQTNAGSSFSIRTALFFALMDVVRTSPVTGTGFAGAHLVIPGAGSAHGQYLDVLLRTGFAGLAFYLFFWGRLFVHYARVDAGVLAGLTAIFVFGVFHETTKLTYGAVIFAVLLNKMYEARAIARERRREAAEAG